MTEKQKQKLLQAVKDGKITDQTTLAVFQMVEELQTRLDEEIPKITDVIARMKGDTGIDGVPGIQGEKGNDGANGKDGQNGLAGMNGKNGKDGRDGKDATVDIAGIISQSSALTEERLKPFIPTIDAIENDLPKLGEKIRDGLELLPKGERLNIEFIDGVDERLKVIENQMNKPISMASIAGRDLVKDIDISASLNGILTTFPLQAIWNVISVNLSSYPYGSLRKNIDYSWTPTSITFLGTIDPTTQLSTGQQCILTVVQS